MLSDFIDPYRLARPMLFRMDPEKAHELALAMLKNGLPVKTAPDIDPVLRIKVAGLDFANPIGLAAGFDKQAEVMQGILDLGFGYTELGSILRHPQPGNPRPRLFRVPEAEAVINRMGFNSEGFTPCLRRLTVFRDQSQGRIRGLVGVNLGLNKDGADAASDYAAGIAAFAPYADYLVVNISSPNTPGLRDLQQREQMKELLHPALAARQAAAKQPPLFVKIAPDLTEAQMEDIASVALSCDIDGIIVGNTTVSRPGSIPPHLAAEAGGLSGRPLFQLSTEVLGRIYKLTRGKITLIGCGGVFSGEDAYAKIRHGASLIQLYTALIYEGPSVVARIARDLASLLKRDGFKSVSEAVGADIQ
jgi:dihydroorotate dehydrogenase